VRNGKAAVSYGPIVTQRERLLRRVRRNRVKEDDVRLIVHRRRLPKQKPNDEIGRPAAKSAFTCSVTSISTTFGVVPVGNVGTVAIDVV